jgi:hypothetical protein
MRVHLVKENKCNVSLFLNLLESKIFIFRSYILKFVISKNLAGDMLYNKFVVLNAIYNFSWQVFNLKLFRVSNLCFKLWDFWKKNELWNSR